jgi:hypothetical protein
MILLVATMPAQLESWRHPNLGILCSPKYVFNDDVQNWPWAADNDAFSRFDARLYRRMLELFMQRRGCLFVSAPDVVGDASATLRRFEQWQPELEQTGLPIALVAQDGLHLHDVPWQQIAALFIGGTSYWKMGEQARALAAEAKQRDKWLHMGRVNGERRLMYAKALGCNSVDGTSMARYRNDRRRLQRFLRVAGEPRQLLLEPL